MLEWATFAAAALAAVGTFLGPVVATRTATASRRQADVDRYIAFALEPDAVTCRLGVAQLQYLLSRGDLSAAQLNAVSEAITAGLQRLQAELEADPDALVALETGTAEAATLDGGEENGPRTDGGGGA